MTLWKLTTGARPPRGQSSMLLTLEADSEHGTLTGTLIYGMGTPGDGSLILDPPDGEYSGQPATYNVSGTWTASYSQHQPDKKFSVFSVSGSDGAVLPMFIAADGTMDGPGNAPTGIRIKVNTASSQYGTLTQDTLSLRPAASGDE